MSTAAHRAYVAPRPPSDVGLRLAGLGWIVAAVAYLVVVITW